MSYWTGPSHYCVDCRFRAVDADGDMCGVCIKAADLMDAAEGTTFCEACAEAPANEGWLCGPCAADLDEATTPDADAPPGRILCSSCSNGTASIWGLCDDCYDDAHNTRNTYRRAWEWPEPKEPVVPPFAAEVTHHRGVPPFAREATHHRRVTSNA